MPSRRDLANAIRALSMDAVEAAKSGHPGMPMGMADIAEVLWNDLLRHNPGNPHWVDRDRFVLSNGHGSMLAYSLLHLSGYDLPLEELRNFRQLHSRTPGHPEYRHTPGIETTTGPLGQGLANAVGMAIAEKTLAAHFNRPGHEVVDHRTWVFVGDGCLMEGISHEACSLAGTLGLGKLNVVYDDNGISIDGEVRNWFTDDTPARFEAYGWHVVRDVDGHDSDAIAAALNAAVSETARPTLVCCKTIIGFGSPAKQGRESSHGAPLGPDEVKAAREQLGWPHAPFEIPHDIRAGWDARARGADMQAAWDERFAAYRAAHPALAAEFLRRVSGELPANFAEHAARHVAECADKPENIATRAASRNSLAALGEALPELFGGSADLTGSNLTKWSGSRPISADDADGNYLYFGVREFAMCAIGNGIALHGGLIPYVGTFLVFSDYARNAVRMASLMKVRNIFVFTHDSIGLGEDGPTHQPVEHAATLRLIPGMSVWRPCDTVETALAWRAAITRADGPTALLLSRQGVAHQARDAAQLADAARGGYVLRDCDGVPEAIIIATGSEVQLAVAAAETAQAAGRRVRVVSMPCCDLFDAQDAAYRDAVLPPAVRARVSVEAGCTGGWYRYIGLDGVAVGLDSFGESAPAKAVYEYFRITADRVAAAVEESIARSAPASASSGH